MRWSSGGWGFVAILLVGQGPLGATRLGERIELAGPKGPVALAFSHDSKWLVSVGADGRAVVYEVAARKEAARLIVPASVRHVAFSPDGKWLVLASTEELWAW